MARHLCIVARENSPLYGFLTIAFTERPAGPEMLDVVLDRRRVEAGRESDRHSLSPSPTPAPYTDRRRQAKVAEALRTRGYAIVAGPGGMPDASVEAFIERAVGLLADVERRGPLALRFHQRRRAVARAIVGVATGGVIVFAIVWVLVTLPTIGGLARVTDDVGRWTDTGVSRLEGAWTALRRAIVSTPPGREQEVERARPPEPARSVAESVPAPAPAETERAAPALPPAAPRPDLLPPPRPAPPPSRAVERPPVSLSARSAAPRAPAAESTLPAPRETRAREARSRDGQPREATPREATPLESSELADTRSLTAFSGLPRVEFSRRPFGLGGDIVYTVRLADPGGRPVPGAQVWMRGQTGDGQARETRLDAVDPPGTYRSGPLPPGTLPPQLSVRVYFSNMRVEVPIEP